MLKIVFVGAVPDIHLGLETLAAPLTRLPIPCMAFIIMVRTERVTGVIAGTTIAHKRKEHIGVLVIANPMATAFRARQVSCLAA